MAIRYATPYLILGGRAAEAIPFYEKALGARLETIKRFGEVEHDCPVALRERVMHAALAVGDARLFLTDGSPEEAVTPGGTVNVALELDSAPQARAIFDGLATGGHVVQPLVETPWGALFGALRDRYGINWMFHAQMG